MWSGDIQSLILLLASGSALFISLIATPLVCRLAHYLGVVDRPDGHRKLHGRIVATGGGIAVATAAILGVAITYAASSDWTPLFEQNARYLIGLAGATVLICGLGLIDDWLELRGRQKLIGQFVAVSCIVLGGLTIEEIVVFGWKLELGLLAVPFTLFWLLGTINALNLIDGVDGLATVVGIIFAVTLASLAWIANRPIDALCAATTAGALLGFLVYNLPPARIYLGDAGSMTIGLLLGAIAIRSSLKGPATVAMAAPTAIWAVLIFDVGAAILRRRLTGQSIYASDRGHLHHVLQRHGMSGPFTVLIIGILCAICALGALASVVQKSEIMAVGTVAAVIATLVATRFFGHTEFALLARRAKGFGASLLRLPQKGVPESQSHREPVVSRFHGHREWELLWESLVEFAERFDLSLIQLNVNSPSIGEDYHAIWERRVSPPMLRMWRTEVPLLCGPVAVGRLTICGAASGGSACGWMAELIEGLKPFEIQMNDLLEHDLHPPVTVSTATPEPASRPIRERVKNR